MEARKDECREALGLRLLDDLRADVRYAFRMLRQSPAFTVVAILSLALGIGANTAIFTLMEAALWKTIPVKNPEQLRLLSWVSGPKEVMDSSWGDWNQTPAGVSSASFSYAAFQAMQHHNGGVQNLFAFKPTGRVIAVIDGHAELVNSELVSGNFYESAGVSTIAGRPIVAAADVRSGGRRGGHQRQLLVMARMKPDTSEPQTQAALDVVLRQVVRDSLPNKKGRDMPRLRLLTGS